MNKQDDELNNLRAFKRHQEELIKRVEELNRQKKILEDHYSTLDTRTSLPQPAETADAIFESKDFKTKFCQLYNQRLSVLVNVAELVTEVLLPSNLPITLPALIAIKLSKIGIEHYCSDVNSK